MRCFYEVGQPKATCLSKLRWFYTPSFTFSCVWITSFSDSLSLCTCLGFCFSSSPPFFPLSFSLTLNKENSPALWLLHRLSSWGGPYTNSLCNSPSDQKLTVIPLPDWLTHHWWNFNVLPEILVCCSSPTSGFCPTPSPASISALPPRFSGPLWLKNRPTSVEWPQSFRASLL